MSLSWHKKVAGNICWKESTVRVTVAQLSSGGNFSLIANEVQRKYTWLVKLEICSNSHLSELYPGCSVWRIVIVTFQMRSFSFREWCDSVPESLNVETLRTKLSILYSCDSWKYLFHWLHDKALKLYLQIEGAYTFNPHRPSASMLRKLFHFFDRHGILLKQRRLTEYKSQEVPVRSHLWKVKEIHGPTLSKDVTCDFTGRISKHVSGLFLLFLNNYPCFWSSVVGNVISLRMTDDESN